MSSLPPGWDCAPLEQLVSILDSKRVPLNAAEREKRTAGRAAGSLFPYFGATGQAGWVDDYLFDEPLILLGEDGVPFLDRLRAKAYLVQGKCWVNNHAHVLRASDALIDRRILASFLNIFDYQGRVTGSTRLKLTQEAMRSIPVPLAPRGEQKRIAAKLDVLLARVDACRQRLDRVPAILKHFRQSVLAAATSGELTREWREERGGDLGSQELDGEDSEAIRGYSFPATWAVRRLSDVAEITGGLTKDSKKQSGRFRELPYLRVANVQRGYLDLREMKTIRVPPERESELLLRRGDVLFNEGGDIDKLGRGWVWNDELPACVFQNHVFRARLRDPRHEPRYFSWYGNSRGYEYFLARGKQTTNLASINKSVLSALPVAVPPQEEQAEIVRRVDAFLQAADDLERSCRTATGCISSLGPAILARAFRGELVPQDPNDEPASALLDRVRSVEVSPATPSRPSRTSRQAQRLEVPSRSNQGQRFAGGRQAS